MELAISETPPLKLFTGTLRDISRRRRMEREIIEIASLEQRRIGCDLHDSVGQAMTALRLLADELTDTLQYEPPEGIELVVQLSDGLQRVQNSLWRIMRGLYPAVVENNGLLAALTEVAEHVQQQGRVHCALDYTESEPITGNQVATHLHLITQEGSSTRFRQKLDLDDGIRLIQYAIRWFMAHT